MKIKKIIFKKITFINIKNLQFKNILSKKGVYLFPSGPGLSSLNYDTKYSKSLKEADYVFFDSGYFVLLLRFLKKIKVYKYSGYIFLKNLFYYLHKNYNKKVLCVDPTPKQSINNKKFLKNLGLKRIYNYIAPTYNYRNIKDQKLLQIINNFKPNFIIINLGGGTQEILGVFLKKNLKFKTCIFCTGAAISYFTGDQAPVNNFFDKLYLGWFLRIIFKPQIFFLRYFNAIKLFHIVRYAKISIKYR